jgi:hypothetical protein
MPEGLDGVLLHPLDEDHVEDAEHLAAVYVIQRTAAVARIGHDVELQHRVAPHRQAPHHAGIKLAGRRQGLPHRRDGGNDAR